MALVLGLYPMLNLECGWNTENVIEMWIGSEKTSHALDQAQEYNTVYLNDGSFYQLIVFLGGEHPTGSVP